MQPMLPLPIRPASARATRLVSALELLVGAGVVIGHNVLRVLPNEVLILAVLGLVSMRVRNGGWLAMGFRRPDSWTRILVIAVVAAALRLIISEYVIEPFATQFWPAPKAPEGVHEARGNWEVALIYLGLVWSFAAFGEEIAYRGYLNNRAADVGRQSNAAVWIAIVLGAVLFGYGHYYKGPAGVLDSGFAGLILGGAYVLAGRNMWANVLAHGLIDTFGLTLLFFGLDS